MIKYNKNGQSFKFLNSQRLVRIWQLWKRIMKKLVWIQWTEKERKRTKITMTPNRELNRGSNNIQTALWTLAKSPPGTTVGG
jgi:hypothetical protein